MVFFRNLRSICRPQYRLFLFLFNFSPDTAAELRVSSRPLLSPQPATRSPPLAGDCSSMPSTSLGHAPVFTAAKLHSLPASAPQPSPRLSQLQHKYAAGLLVSDANARRPPLARNHQCCQFSGEISKVRYLLIKVVKRPREDIGC